MHQRIFHGLLFIGVLLFSLHARAGLSMVHTQRYVAAQSEVLEHETWLLADEIQFDGVAQQAFLAAANEATLNGIFQKELWVVGAKIHWNGQAHESLRVAGQNSVQLHGAVSNNVTVVSATSLVINESAVIDGDAWLASPTIVMLGHVKGSALVWGNEITIGGRFDQSLHVRAPDIVIRPGTRIEGNLYYMSPQEPAIPDSAMVRGEVKRIPLPVAEPASTNWAMQFFFFVAAFLTGLAFLSALPRLADKAVKRVRHQFWKAALAGGIGLFVVPVISLGLLLLLVGIPLALALGAWYLTTLYLAKIVVALAIAGVIFQRDELAPQPLSALILGAGLLLFYIVSALPMIGVPFMILVSITGFGGLILGIKDVQFAQPDIKKPQSEQPDDLSNDPWTRSP